MAYPELTDKQRNYPYSGNVQNPLVVPETRGVVLPTGATPEQTAAGKQNWQSNAPQQFANNPVGTVQYNIFKAMEQQKPAATTQPQGNGTGTAAGTTNSRTSSGNGATETGGTRPIRSMDDLVSAMYTDPQQEEKLRKASVANQRIMAVGDALRHIGNIFHTVNYAPSQQFNNPVQEEYARYERGKALRDKANLTYLNYQQAKANQDLKMQQLSDSTDLKLRQLAFNQDKFNRQQNLNEFKAKNDEWYKKATVDQKEKALDIQQALADGRISLMEAQTELAKVKTAVGGFAPKSGSRGGSGSKTGGFEQVSEEWKEGDKKFRKVTKTPTGTYDQQRGVQGFSIHNNKPKVNQKKTNVGSFSIRK